MIVASINCLENIEEHFKTQMIAWVRAAADFGEINDELVKENEQLKKNAILWHKVTCFDEPDENGYITASNPAEEGKEYLILLKNKRILISKLDCDDDGYFFEDIYWEDIEAWAELPEV